MHHERTRQNLKPLNFQAQNSSEAFINSLYLCTFGLMEEWRVREWLHFSLLHERAAQFPINLTSHALNLNDFDRRRAESAEFRGTVMSGWRGLRQVTNLLSEKNTIFLLHLLIMWTSKLIKEKALFQLILKYLQRASCGCKRACVCAKARFVYCIQRVR